MSEPSQALPSLAMPTMEHLNKWTCREIEKLLQHLLEEEVTAFLGRSPHVRVGRNPEGAGMRNGYGRSSQLDLGCGGVVLRPPRLRPGKTCFKSQIFPLVARRARDMGALIPGLFLRAFALGDFGMVLDSLLGGGGALRSDTLGQMKKRWDADLALWRQKPLDNPRIALAWADTITVRTGPGQETETLLVVVGQRLDGQSEVLTLATDFKESTQNWLALQYDLVGRGLSEPLLLVPGGGMAFWSSVELGWPKVLHQLSWFHKLVSVLEQLPKKDQSQAHSLLALIPAAPNRKEAEKRKNVFIERFQDACPEAVEALERDWEHMLAIYDIRQP